MKKLPVSERELARENSPQPKKLVLLVEKKKEGRGIQRLAPARSPPRPSRTLRDPIISPPKRGGGAGPLCPCFDRRKIGRLAISLCAPGV